MIKEEDLLEYSVKEGQLYNVSKHQITGLGLEKKTSYIGVIQEVDEWELTYDGEIHGEVGYLEYTQRYAMLVNLDIIKFEKVVFCREKQDLDFEHRASSIRADKLSLLRRYGTCLFRISQCR